MLGDYQLQTFGSKSVSFSHEVSSDVKSSDYSWMKNSFYVAPVRDPTTDLPVTRLHLLKCHHLLPLCYSTGYIGTPRLIHCITQRAYHLISTYPCGTGDGLRYFLAQTFIGLKYSSASFVSSASESFIEYLQNQKSMTGLVRWCQVNMNCSPFGCGCSAVEA